MNRLVSGLRCGPSARLYVLVCVTSVVGTLSGAHGRSSLTARFDAPVVGPHLEQTADLIVDLFPGDGEAVLGAAAVFPRGGLEILTASSRLGQATVEGHQIHLDYGNSPVGERATDTLSVELRAHDTGQLIVDVTLRSNIDDPATSAHRAEATLRVDARLQVEATLAPNPIYPGEAVEVTLTLLNGDDRTLEAIDVAWPPDMTADPTVAVTTAPGDSARSSWPVRVGRSASGELAVGVSARGGGVLASPVAIRPLLVAAVPAFAIGIDGEAVLEQPLRVQLQWTNSTETAIAFEVLGARVAAGFAGAQLAERIAATRVDAEPGIGAVEVWVSGPGELAAGQRLTVDLDVTPTSTGPFAWVGQFRPPDRDISMNLGVDVLRVVAPAPEQPVTAAAITDLELVAAGLSQELGAAVDAMPLSRGASVQLQTDNKDDADWVVEGMLTQSLLGRGIRVLGDEGAGQTLHYRVADARVVYSPGGSSWNPFSSVQRRDGRAVVYLRLEDAGGRVLWAQRVDSSTQDPDARHEAAWLSAGSGFPQATVEADHRALELGLSGIIVGGLFFVFFAP